MPAKSHDQAARVIRKAITRSDVARYAGVSDAVISYVLNGGPKPVADATRKRVLEAVAVLGYSPNAAARALSRGTTDMIGMMVPDSRNPYFAELVYAVDTAAQNTGRTLLVINSDSRRPTATDHIVGLASHQLDGLIVADMLTAAERTLVTSLNIPVVLINQFQDFGDIAAIGVDYYEGAKSAVRHLIEHGHRDVAFIGGDPEIDRRERGWMDALSEAALPLGPRYRVDFSLAGGHRAALELADSSPRATAVFIASDQLAVGATAALHARNVRIPEDIAVISFDGTAESAYTWPPLTTVAQPVAQIAEGAVRLLLGDSTGEGFTTYPTSLTLRQSCGCPGN